MCERHHRPMISLRNAQIDAKISAFGGVFPMPPACSLRLGLASCKARSPYGSPLEGLHTVYFGVLLSLTQNYS
jgi:hypothetical protein